MRGERGLEHVRQDTRENTCARTHTHTHTHTNTGAHTAQPASGVALRLRALARRHVRPRSAKAHTFGCVEHAEQNVPNQSAMFRDLQSCTARLCSAPFGTALKADCQRRAELSAPPNAQALGLCSRVLGRWPFARDKAVTVRSFMNGVYTIEICSGLWREITKTRPPTAPTRRLDSERDSDSDSERERALLRNYGP